MFKDVERFLDHLKSLLMRTIFDWSQARGFTHWSSILEF